MVSRVANFTFDTDKALKEFLDSSGGFKDHPFSEVNAFSQQQAVDIGLKTGDISTMDPTTFWLD